LIRKGEILLDDSEHGREDCRALTEVLKRIGDRWTILVVGLLGRGPLRFNELRRTITGITQRMLTLTLRGLERDGLVSRTQFATNPPTVEYALTERGRSLLVPLIALAQWGNEHRAAIGQSREHYDQAQALADSREEPAGVHRIAARGR
jgi:DNA-binding HxlR family transcriptional regulator